MWLVTRLHRQRQRGPGEEQFQHVDIYGGRAALKVDLDDNWTATPTFMYQKTKSKASSSTIQRSVI